MLPPAASPSRGALESSSALPMPRSKSVSSSATPAGACRSEHAGKPCSHSVARRTLAVVSLIRFAPVCAPRCSRSHAHESLKAVFHGENLETEIDKSCGVRAPWAFAPRPISQQLLRPAARPRDRWGCVAHEQCSRIEHSAQNAPLRWCERRCAFLKRNHAQFHCATQVMRRHAQSSFRRMRAPNKDMQMKRVRGCAEMCAPHN